MPRSHSVPARPRPHLAFQAVSAPEGGDAALHRPGRRSLPDTNVPHARDDRHRAVVAPGARAERGSVEAIGPRSRYGHPPFGHAGESALDGVLADGFRHNEQSARIARRLNLTHEVVDGILTHTVPQEPGTHEGRSSGPTASPTSTTTSTMPSVTGSSRSATRRAARSRSSAPRARGVSTASSTTSSTGGSRRHHPERRGRLGDALARAFMFERVH